MRWCFLTQISRYPSFNDCRPMTLTLTEVLRSESLRCAKLLTFAGWAVSSNLINLTLAHFFGALSIAWKVKSLQLPVPTREIFSERWKLTKPERISKGPTGFMLFARSMFVGWFWAAVECSRWRYLSPTKPQRSSAYARKKGGGSDERGGEGEDWKRVKEGRQRETEESVWTWGEREWDGTNVQVFHTITMFIYRHKAKNKNFGSFGVKSSFS